MRQGGIASSYIFGFCDFMTTKRSHCFHHNGPECIVARQYSFSQGLLLPICPVFSPCVTRCKEVILTYLTNRPCRIAQPDVSYSRLDITCLSPPYKRSAPLGYRASHLFHPTHSIFLRELPNPQRLCAESFHSSVTGNFPSLPSQPQ
jgi:hypothetical protein